MTLIVAATLRGPPDHDPLAILGIYIYTYDMGFGKAPISSEQKVAELPMREGPHDLELPPPIATRRPLLRGGHLHV